jgi:hypothetical protein
MSLVKRWYGRFCTSQALAIVPLLSVGAYGYFLGDPPMLAGALAGSSGSNSLLGSRAYQLRPQNRSKQDTVWAAISVQPSVFYEGHTNALQVYFTVINDGTISINPRIESTHLLINGVEPKDWPIVIGNGIRSTQFLDLPPGEPLQFSYLLARYFEKPGIYTLRWYGDNFRAADITFRVLPGKK